MGKKAEKVDRGDDFEPTGDDAVTENNTPDTDEELEAAIAAIRGDEKAEAEETEETEEKEEPIMIPKARFDEQREKMNKRIAALEAQLQSQQPRQQQEPKKNPVAEAKENLRSAREAYEEALLEGDAAAAKQHRAQVEQFEDAVLEAMYKATVSQASNTSTAQIRYETTLAVLEQEYPQINPDNDAFDQDVVDDIVALSTGYQNRGMDSATALKTAVTKLLRKPEAPKEQQKEGLRRSQEARKAIANAAVNQGKDLSSVGLSTKDAGPKLDPAKLNETQFAQLPDDVKAKLRGDFLDA